MVFPLLLFFLIFGCSQAWHKDYYTAAVYEHSRQGRNIKHDAAGVIKSNLEYYKRATKLASKQGADLILFPEYGLFSPSHNRSDMKRYLEYVPDPSQVKVTPCDQKKLFADRQILYSLSCMAKRNEIVVVANMGSIEKCAGEIGCPEDGDLQLNTNVAFDRKGTLIARYFKEHLFFELSMDLPREPQNPIFDTEFGRFGMFICFDIIFEKMSKVSRMEDVDAVLFPTMWMNSSPFSVATQAWQAFAVGNNATILAANIQMPGWLATGSGIFTGVKNSVAHTLNPDGKSKLIVARVPRRRTGGGISSASTTVILKNKVVREWEDDGKDIPETCSYDILGPAEDPLKDYRCFNEKMQNYTLAKLTKAKDHLQLCNNNMCCQLNYSANGMNESYYFGVYNGTYNAFNRYFWWEENCFLARCDDWNGTTCSSFPTVSHGTHFHGISLTANFTTKYTYPSFLSNRDRLLSPEDWTFSKKADSSSIAMYSDQGIPLIAAIIKGRVYYKDPPYIR